MGVHVGVARGGKSQALKLDVADGVVLRCRQVEENAGGGHNKLRVGAGCAGAVVEEVELLAVDIIEELVLVVCDGEAGVAGDKERDQNREVENNSGQDTDAPLGKRGPTATHRIPQRHSR